MNDDTTVEKIARCSGEGCEDKEECYRCIVPDWGDYWEPGDGMVTFWWPVVRGAREENGRYSCFIPIKD